jgi:predicted Zn-dependent protease
MTMEHCLNKNCSWNTGRAVADGADSKHYCPDCRKLADQLLENHDGT